MTVRYRSVGSKIGRLCILVVVTIWVFWRYTSFLAQWTLRELQPLLLQPSPPPIIIIPTSVPTEEPHQPRGRKKKKLRWKRRKIFYEKYTSYAQLLEASPMNLATPSDDDFYFSNIIPTTIRQSATDGKECHKYYVHHNYGDGFGHQLADIAAAMVYHLLNRNHLCYLGIVYYDGNHNQFDHGCNSSCIEIYNALNRQWPGIDHYDRNKSKPIYKFDSNSLWKKIVRAGGEKQYQTQLCPRCDRARMTVARLWVDVIKKIAEKKNIPTVDIAIHIRKGDFPRKVCKTYADAISVLFPKATLDVFTEFRGEAQELLTQLGDNHEVRIHEGGDAARDWLTMARAKVLFVHESSYSISASIASEGIIFSQYHKPYQGRYDNHWFPCGLDGGWWVSTGIHGNTTCDSEKILSLSRSLIEKYANHHDGPDLTLQAPVAPSGEEDSNSEEINAGEDSTSEEEEEDDDER